jgi:site-specific recombinase XerD
VLTETEYRRLREAVGHRPRMAAIVELMLQTGIRIGELVKLQLRDVQLPSVSGEERGQLGELWIRQGKGRKGRRLPLNRRVCGALRTYLAVRPQAETPALFLSKYRQPLSARAVEHLFHKYLAIARIEDASPHTLRHTMATHMIKSGATLRSVQEMLGHANIQTTSRYVSLAEEQLHKDVQDHAL